MKEFTVYNRESGDIDVASYILVDENINIIYVGRAYRSPIDQPNRKLGRKIAQGRAVKMVDIFNGDSLPEKMVNDIKNRTHEEITPDTVAAAVTTVPFREVNYCRCHYSNIQGIPRLVTAFAMPVEDADQFLSCREAEVLRAYAFNKGGLEESINSPLLSSAGEMVKDLREMGADNPELKAKIIKDIKPLFDLLKELVSDGAGDSGEQNDNEESSGI